jgi:lactoylglutathione lyase
MGGVRYIHTMVRVSNLDEAIDFYVDKLGLEVRNREEHAEGRFTLVFLAMPGDTAEIELTYNWDAEHLGSARNFGHIAFEVDNIYDVCDRIRSKGVVLARPPRDGRLAFVRSPDHVSIEFLQKGKPLPARDPYKSMSNVGTW